ncbi:putative START-like domain, Bet v I type allergen [Lupinus albus]|uniref:Putative START-like domain, Bet v I type allergen n=1 Tax=Lupinus albus TaxID=3870 RepID=A0A6A4NRQ8_LUPAL|nr:putative START-like domain, Bet v I type allergen [Lupinus albus]
MAVLTFTDESTTTVQAERLFKSLILDAHNLIPKLLPQAIKKVELVQGNGGPGSIQEITIVEGDNIKHLKHRIDALDKENLAYSYTVIEGDSVLEKVDSVSHEIKFEATAEGGSKTKNISKYQPKEGVDIKEEDFKADREEASTILKVVEAYLVANPEAYA